ncbi:MAG: outer membrane beta-barrel protein [Cyclobacteriaceae bacterium]|nr:outer membrane beta-barrel protein [Cyclobacteriaceae bacterium]
MRQLSIFLMVFGLAQAALAQHNIVVNGSVVDLASGSALPGVTVLLVNVKDSTLSQFAVTNEAGAFEIDKLEKAFYRVNINYLGYKPYSRLLRIATEHFDFGAIAIEEDVKLLENINVVGEAIPVEIKGDTVLYNADAYKVNPDASTTDLVSKMPGIVVDNSGVSANGEKIQQVLLDGKRFFGQDPLLSLNTIPAEVVNKIEVFDQKSERAQFTGFDDGNTTKTMNVVTREEKRNGVFGKIYGGYGTDDHYSAGATINKFSNGSQLTFLGMSNNINQQNFSSEDLVGISGAGAARRGGFRGSAGGDGNFMTGNQSGITNTNSAGLNFSDNIGKKATFEGSYFFNNSANTNDQLTSRELFRESGSQYYEENKTSDSDNLNHRLNMRITYNINENNKLIYIPALSYQVNYGLDHTIGQTTNSLGGIINQTDNTYKSTNTGYNLNNSLIFQHKFEKIGRSVSFQVDSRVRNTNRENYFEDLAIDSVTQYLSDENNNSFSSTITYAEPVGNSGQLSGSYRINFNTRDSDKETFLIDSETDDRVFSPQLSNLFVSDYTTHLPTITYSNRGFGRFYTFGLSYQRAALHNEQTYPEVRTFQKSFNSILPTAMGRIELKGGMNVFFRYATSTDEPSVSQLQNVIDNSNPLFISLGNPGLNQSYSHTLMVRADKFNTDKNTSLGNFVRVETTSNYMTNATEFAASDTVLAGGIVIQKGAQLSRPINMNGYWNFSNSTTFSKLISKIKSNLNTTLGLGYVRRPGQTDGIVNISNTYAASMKLSLVSNISAYVDFNTYYNVSANTVSNSIQTKSNSNSRYIIQTVGGKMNLIFWKGLVFRNDIYYENYNGFSDAFSSSYVLWNMSVAAKFLKNDLGELELSVFDILNQNQSFSQNINPNYIEEISTQVLRQYFMLKFTYQLRSFSAAKK